MERETRWASRIVVPLVGALITLMSGVNSRLAGHVGNLVAIVVIHMVGLAAISAISLVKREEGRPGRLPVYLYLGGLVGVGTVFSSNYAFAALGASLAVALALLGQTFCSVAIDAAGLLGRKKYPLSARRLPGTGLAIVGVAIMAQAVLGPAVGGTGSRAASAEGARPHALAMLVALLSGALPALSFTLNSELGRCRGVLRSTRANYLVGLATAVVIALAAGPHGSGLVDAARSVAAAGPFLVAGGGLMGVVVVAAMNFTFPRVSAFAATLLLFSGQALAGVLLDAIVAGALDLTKLVGIVVLLAGLTVDSLLLERGRSEGTADARAKRRVP